MIPSPEVPAAALLPAKVVEADRALREAEDALLKAGERLRAALTTAEQKQLDWNLSEAVSGYANALADDFIERFIAHFPEQRIAMKAIARNCLPSDTCRCWDEEE